MIPITTPSIEQNPRHSQWLSFDRPGIVHLRCGKVDIGQGIGTALIQIAADALNVPVEQFTFQSGDTEQAPNEGYTAGSMSIEHGGSAVRLAALSARRLFVAEAARKLGVGPDRLHIAGGKVFLESQPTSLDYWNLAPDIDLDKPVSTDGGWESPSPGSLLGTNVPRVDLSAKVTGAAFVHDMTLDNMLHGRVVRPPSPAAKLVRLDTSAVERRFPDARIYRNGSFVAVVAPVEFDAVRAAELLATGSKWDEAETLPTLDGWFDYLSAQPSMDETTERGQRRPPTAGTHSVSASYSRPPIAHASMAPSCAVARFENGKLTVFTASQNVFNLRRAMAMGLGMDETSIRIVHRESAGCYGHNGQDDAAMDAALLAIRFAPEPVRLQWSRAEELAWAPFGTPMAVRLAAELDGAGAIMHWNTELWSGTSAKRPGFLPHLVDLLATFHLDPPIPMSNARDNPTAFVGAMRNAEPPYEVPFQRITQHKLPELPLRTSSLRTLGGFCNVFAIECFMDELAQQAGVDPLEFRLRHLHDPRGRKVLETVAEMASWDQRSSGPGKALGIGYSRYKNTAAYVAVIAEVETGDDLRVSHLYAAVDAGLVINPDGLLNQMEGGLVQAMSWTTQEQVRFDSRGITSNSWGTYPISRFGDVPPLAVQIVPQDGSPPLGVGEAAQGPAGAAIANAAAAALGFRVRDLPITRAGIVKAMSRAAAKEAAVER